eukprot:177812-Karenia_brevis.AAC.1
MDEDDTNITHQVEEAAAHACDIASQPKNCGGPCKWFRRRPPCCLCTTKTQMVRKKRFRESRIA